MCRRRRKNLWLRAKNRFKIACVCSFFFFAQWEIDESHTGIFGREITFVSFLHNVKQKKKNHPLLISSMSWSRNSITLHKKTLRRCLLMTVFLCSVCVLASVVRTQRQRLFVFRSHDHWAQRTYNKKKKRWIYFCDVALRQWRWSSNQFQVYDVIFAFWFRLLNESSSHRVLLTLHNHASIAHGSVSARSIQSVVWAHQSVWKCVYFFFGDFVIIGLYP